MKIATDAVCPIFVLYSDSEKLEQIGSGVLIDVKGKAFLLTAAHVTDWMGKGSLCIPIDNRIEEITGHFASISVPSGLTRQADKLDMAYFSLDDNIAARLKDSFSILSRKEYWLTDNLMEGDVYTFTGYPLSKAKNSSTNQYTSEIFSYTGEAAINRKYETLKFDPDSNILINFRLKKATDPSSGEKRRPPHPNGISGGAIFRWSKHQPNPIERTLVGIGHTYLSKHNCLVGTKLQQFIGFIAANHNELFVDDGTDNQHTIPMFLCLVAYKREEWEILMTQFDDAANMHNSWIEWRNAAEYGIEHMDRTEKTIIPIELSADEIQIYCKTNSLPNTGKSRTELANKKLHSMIIESEIK